MRIKYRSSTGWLEAPDVDALNCPLDVPYGPY